MSDVPFLSPFSLSKAFYPTALGVPVDLATPERNPIARVLGRLPVDTVQSHASWVRRWRSSSMARKTSDNQSARLRQIEKRLLRVEQLLKEKNAQPRETPIKPWRFLVRRRHPWRRQLYLKGRNLTARQLAGSIKANRMDDKKAAANYHLPIQAIREALAYVDQNADLLRAEAEIERLMHQRAEAARVAQPVS